MKTKKTKLMYFVLLLVPALAMLTSACGTTSATALPPTETVTYKEFTLPFPEDISFELPDNWDSWANAGYLSPDDGKTYAGVRLVWIEEGRDAEEALYNEGSTVHEKTTVMIGDLETHRYIVEVTLTSASTNEVISHTYEMIYAFPAPNGEMMAGVVFSAPSREELEPLVPIAEHMVQTLTWGSGD
jgi:hypothetical protein